MGCMLQVHFQLEKWILPSTILACSSSLGDLIENARLWQRVQMEWDEGRSVSVHLNVKSCYARKHYFIFWSLTNVNVMIFASHSIHWSSPNRFFNIIYLWCLQNNSKKNLLTFHGFGVSVESISFQLVDYIVANCYFVAYSIPLFKRNKTKSLQTLLPVCGWYIFCICCLFISFILFVTKFSAHLRQLYRNL